VAAMARAGAPSASRAAVAKVMAAMVAPRYSGGNVPTEEMP
jgi:hypothetical protein